MPSPYLLLVFNLEVLYIAVFARGRLLAPSHDLSTQRIHNTKGIGEARTGTRRMYLISVKTAIFTTLVD